MADTLSYNAINGKELRDIIKINFGKKVDSTPMLKIGNSFHKVQIAYSAQITAFPNEVEIPDIEYVEIFSSPAVVNGKLDSHFAKIDEVFEYRIKLLAKLEELDSILDKAMPEENIDETVGGDKPPDEVRIEHGLPVPVTKIVNKETGRKAEVNVPFTLNLNK